MLNKNYLVSGFRFKLLFAFSVYFLLSDGAAAQFLRSLLQDSTNNNETVLRDDLPSDLKQDELLYEEIICRDIDTFPKKIKEMLFTNYFECKADLDRIQNASYVDLTYRIRWDNDRLDVYRTGTREIYICDGPTLSLYEHNSTKDPDWWMISRNSPELVECFSDEIIIDSLD